jgi:hypothetical protein
LILIESTGFPIVSGITGKDRHNKGKSSLPLLKKEGIIRKGKR